LTVSGPGGAGKTRFAVKVAHRVREERFRDYPDGVFACFSALRDPELVLPTIAQTLSRREQPEIGALETLSGQLEAKQLLLVLDNLEHLLPVAPQLSELLQACPGLTLLCTSRETLRLQRETVYPLPALSDDQGVALFCGRARTEPTTTIELLCQRLDGLPLALELAAARLTILTTQQVLERLSQRLDLLKAGRDADPRQQTLRATIQWSHDLLAPKEQQLFGRLSVFAGGCALDAAEESDPLHRPALLDARTIREYAVEQLEATGEATAVRRAHREVYAQQLAPLWQLVRNYD
jgi:non-specific serine/threonine protein kinase